MAKQRLNTYTVSDVQDILDSIHNGTVTGLRYYYTKQEADEKHWGMGGFVTIDELPTASFDTMNKIYLIPGANPNTKDEYITVNYGEEPNVTYDWIKVGSTDIDLPNLQAKALTNPVTIDGTQYLTVEAVISALSLAAATHSLAMGNLSSLKTSTKSDIVSALNELVCKTVNTNNFSGITALEDNTSYIVVTSSNITLPSIPSANDNRYGITVQITADTNDVSISFPTGYVPKWYGNEPNDTLISAGKTIILSILDGICAFNEVTDSSNNS